MNSETKEQLDQLQNIFDNGWISEYEYTRRRKELMGDNYVEATTTTPSNQDSGNSYSYNYNSSNNDIDSSYSTPSNDYNNSIYNITTNDTQTNIYSYNPINNNDDQQIPSQDYNNYNTDYTNNYNNDYNNSNTNNIYSYNPTPTPITTTTDEYQSSYNQYNPPTQDYNTPSSYNYSTYDYNTPNTFIDQIPQQQEIQPEEPIKNVESPKPISTPTPTTTSKVVRDKITERSNATKITYPHQVKDNYKMYQGKIDGFILYFKSHECAYQTDIIPIQDSFKVGGIVLNQFGLSRYTIKKIICKERTVVENEYYNETPAMVTLEEVENITEEGHYMVEPISFILHRRGGLRIQGENLPVYSKDYQIPQYSYKIGTRTMRLYPEYTTGWNFDYVKQKGSPQVYHSPKNYKAYPRSPVITPFWKRLNFINALRSKQIGNTIGNDATLKPTQSNLQILEKLKQSISEFKCVCCGSIADTEFLCSKHMDHNLLQSFNEVKDLLLFVEEPNPAEKNSDTSLSEKEIANKDVVKTETKYKYVDADVLNNLFQSKPKDDESCYSVGSLRIPSITKSMLREHNINPW